jgi:hypothetical protein
MKRPKRHKPFCRGCSKFWNTNHPKTSFSARNRRLFQCSKSFILFSLCVLYTPLPPPFTFYSSIKSFLLKIVEHWNKRSYRLRQGGFLFQKRVLFLEHFWNNVWNNPGTSIVEWGRIVYILWKKETYILSASEIRGNYGIFQKTAFFQKINLPYPPSPLRCLKSMFFLTDLSEMVTYKITH